MKRFQPKARGSAGPIRKRTAHIRIILTDEIEIKPKRQPKKSSAKKGAKPAAKKVAATPAPAPVPAAEATPAPAEEAAPAPAAAPEQQTTQE
jgi:large subunit ribosomal protein L22